MSGCRTPRTRSSPRPNANLARSLPRRSSSPSARSTPASRTFPPKSHRRSPTTSPRTGSPRVRVETLRLVAAGNRNRDRRLRAMSTSSTSWKDRAHDLGPCWPTTERTNRTSSAGPLEHRQEQETLNYRGVFGSAWGFLRATGSLCERRVKSLRARAGSEPVTAGRNRPASEYTAWLVE